MKRFLFTSILMCIAVFAMAQIPLSEYTPVIVDRNGQMVQQPQRSQNNFQTVNAYFINSRGAFQKIRIKVNVVADALGGQAYVRGYKDLTYGMWNNTNIAATPVTQYSADPVVIRENFDWKCNILNLGTIYF